jgi:hypothetical protein
LFFFALALYRGLWPHWFDDNAPKRTEEGSREHRILQAMAVFELCSTMWEELESFRLMDTSTFWSPGTSI